MKEWSQIITAFDALCADGKPSAMATVIAVSGSAYRRPGARMLIAEDGRSWGGISGGCLERDVVRRARGVMASGSPIWCSYETTDDEDLSTGVATGCRGTVDLFIEPLSQENCGTIEVLRCAIEERRDIQIATVISASRALRVPAGTRFIVDDRNDGTSGPPESYSQDTGDPHVRRIFPWAPTPIEYTPIGQSVIDRMRAIDWSAGAQRVSMTFAGGSVDVFFERITPPQSLIIFGGGADVIPVLSMAKSLGWHVTIVGSRPSNGLHERFGSADALHITSSDDPVAGLTIPPEVAVVIMTHNYPRDVRILSQLRIQPRYLGILGPRKRTRALLAQLGTEAGLLDIHGPIGLDLGAQGPEEIAVAIIAEIQAVLRNTTAGFLRDRPGPIHAPGESNFAVKVDRADPTPTFPRAACAM